MPGHALSIQRQKQQAAQVAEEHMRATLASYCAQHATASSPVSPAEHASNCGVSYSTFVHRVKGGKSQGQAAME